MLAAVRGSPVDLGDPDTEVVVALTAANDVVNASCQHVSKEAREKLFVDYAGVNRRKFV